MIIRLCSVLLLAVSIAQAQTFEQNQKVYQEGIAKIEGDSKDKDSLDASYLAALDNLIATYKRAANVDGVKAVLAEKERFSTARTIGVTIPHCKEVQGQYDERLKVINAGKAKQKLDFSQLYIASLKPLITQALTANKMDEAEAINDEVKRIEATIAGLSSGVANLVPNVPRPPVAANLPLKLKAGMVLHYDFERDDKDKVTDKSGSGNHGKVEGAKWNSLTDERKGVMEFDGIDDWIRVPDSRTLDITEKFTVGVYVKQSKLKRARQYGIISKGEFPNYNYRIFGGNVFDTACYLGKFIAAEGKSSVFDKWVHILGTYDGAGLSLYENGLLVTKIAASGGLSVNDHDLAIGRYLFNNAYHFEGQLDDIMIWNRALSEDEVKQLYSIVSGK